MRLVGLLLLLMALLACGASATHIGPHTYSIECKRSLGECYEEAREVCPNGFERLDGADHSSAVVIPNGNSPIIGHAYRGELIVRCYPATQASAH